MIRLSLLLWLAAVSVAAFGLFHIKDRVQDLEAELAQVESEILVDKEAIHVLRAEWAYLNKPSRLAELSAKHLDLVPLDQKHLASFEAVPEARPTPHLQEAVAGEDSSPHDSMASLIESVNSEPPSPPAVAASSQPRQRVLLNPVTGNPLPLPGGSLVLTGASQ